MEYKFKEGMHHIKAIAYTGRDRAKEIEAFTGGMLTDFYNVPGFEEPTCLLTVPDGAQYQLYPGVMLCRVETDGACAYFTMPMITFGRLYEPVTE